MFNILLLGMEMRSPHSPVYSDLLFLFPRGGGKGEKIYPFTNTWLSALMTQFCAKVQKELSPVNISLNLQI
jgi:hypothetical protein